MFAELPDGTRLEFPDGTDPAVMDRVVRQNLQGGAARPASPADARVGFFPALGTGVRQGAEALGEQASTLGALVTGDAEARPTPASEPTGIDERSKDLSFWQKIQRPEWLGQFLGQTGVQSAPFLGGAIAGGAAGAAAGSVVPVVGTALGGIIGAAIGGGSVAGVQQLADSYNEARTAGQPHEQAVDYAIKSGLTSAGINAASIPAAFLGPARSVIGHALTQLVVQPAIGGIDQASQNLLAKNLGVDPERSVAAGVPEAMLGEAIFEAPTAVGGVRALRRKAGEEPPPPAAGAPQEGAAPTPPPEGTPPVGTVLGLAEGDSAPFRAQVDGYSQDGRFVFLRGEDGERITVRAADLPGMVQTAPPPSGRPGDPTAVPTPPEEDVPPPSEDEARFYDQFEAESMPPRPEPPAPPTPQLNLGDPSRGDAMLRGALRQKVEIQTAIDEGRLDPDVGARRLRALDDVVAEAEQRLARVAARPARPDAASVAAAAQAREGERLGDIGRGIGEAAPPEPIDAAAMAAARDLEARQRAGALGQQAGAPRPVEAPDEASIAAARKVAAREEMARMQAPPRTAKPAPVSAKKPKPPQTFLEWLSEVGIREGDPEIADLGETDLLRNWHKDKRFRKKIIRPDGLPVQEIVKQGESLGFIGTNLGGRSMGTAESAGEAQQQYATATTDEARAAIYDEGVLKRPVVRAADREAQADLLAQQAAVEDAKEFAARYGNDADAELRRRAELLGVEAWDTADAADLQEQIAERLAIMEVDTVEDALAAYATVDTPALAPEGYANDFDLTDDIAQEGPAASERAGTGIEAAAEEQGAEVGPEDRADVERAPAPTGERRVDTDQRARYDRIAAEVRAEQPGIPDEALREEVLDRMAEPETEATDQGQQFLAPGVAPVSARERAEAQAAKPLRSDKTQKEADEGLFDEGARRQQDLLSTPPKPRRQPMRRPKKQGREAIEAQNARIIAAATNQLANKINQAGITNAQLRASTSHTPPPAASVGPLRPMHRIGKLWTYFMQASAVADRDRPFARLFGAIQGQHHTETSLIKDGGEKLDSVLRLNDKQAKVFNQIAEYLRLSGKRPKRVGKTLVLRTEPVSITEDVKQEDGSIKQVQRTLKPELSKPGDVIEADEATTQAIYDALKYGEERWMALHGASAQQWGYRGDFTRSGIEKALAEAKSPRERATAEMAKALFEVAEEGKRKAYFPLMRYGDTAIVVKPKPGAASNKMGGKPSVKDGGVFFVQSEGPLSGLFSGTATGRGRVQKRLEELKKRFPPDQYTHEAKYLQTAKDVEALDLPLIDRLMTATNLRNAKQAAEAYKDALNLKTPEYEKALQELARALPGAARKQALDKLKAGIMRESQTVPGYETDFRRALMDYNRSSSGIIARRLYRTPIEEARVSVFGGTDADGNKVSAQSHRSVQQFAERYLDYIDTPEHAAFRTGRWLGFYLNIFGSFGSAAVNGISTATITAPQIAAWSPAGAAGVVPAFRRALRGLSWGPQGFTIDYTKIPGTSPEEAAAIRKAALDGTLAPALGLEFQGTDVGSNIPGGARLNKTLRQYSDIGSSLFNVVEQLNRYTAFIASYRAAQNPAARKRFERQYAKNERVQDIKRTEGLTPATIARFMVDQTQFIGGQLDRPSVLRGAGGVAFQFKTYPVNYTRVLVQNLTQQGWQGKFAAGLMLLSLWSFAGLLGLPFGQDALDIVEIANKALGSGEDDDLEGAIREFIARLYGGERREGESEETYQKRRADALVAAEVWMRGPTREFLGFEGGTRFGVGEVGPEMGDIVQAVPILAGTIGRVQEAQRRSASGQPVGAAVAITSPLVGKGPADVARGLIQYPAEGYQTQRGRQVIDPEDITYGQMALKAIGFQPAEMARKTEKAFAERRELTGDTQVRTNRISELGNLYSQAIKAQEAGDEKRAQRLFDKMGARLEVFAREHAEGRGPPPPDRAAIRQRALENLEPDLRIRRGPKERRERALEVPYVD